MRGPQTGLSALNSALCNLPLCLELSEDRYLVESTDESCLQADRYHGARFLNAMPTDAKVKCHCTEAEAL